VLADLCQNGRMADADQATDEGWLLLVYRVPSEPSRLRAAGQTTLLRSLATAGPGRAPALAGTGAPALGRRHQLSGWQAPAERSAGTS
jgi:hypothetical protein